MPAVFLGREVCILWDPAIDVVGLRNGPSVRGLVLLVIIVAGFPGRVMLRDVEVGRLSVILVVRFVSSLPVPVGFESVFWLGLGLAEAVGGLTFRGAERIVFGLELPVSFRRVSMDGGLAAPSVRVVGLIFVGALDGVEAPGRFVGAERLVRGPLATGSGVGRFAMGGARRFLVSRVLAMGLVAPFSAPGLFGVLGAMVGSLPMEIGGS